MYYRIDSDEVEPLVPAGGKNSHEPLWKRNDPDRIHQIRGILLDDEVNSQVSSKYMKKGRYRGPEVR